MKKYILILLIAVIGLSADEYTNIKAKREFFEPVINKLNERGVDSAFIDYLLGSPSTKFNKKFVNINVTGFLGKPDYSSHYNARAVRKSKKFLNENDDILQKAEDKYGVPKEVITSVLWVETRHGGYLGYNHIPSVYLSTAMAEQDEYIKMNKKELHRKFDGDKSELPKLEKKIKRRASKKANWALDQLVALQKVDSLMPIPVVKLKGSWAGAFGMSQFLPESYVKWAVDGNGDNVVNLFEKEDAIYSVANYLKTNGWGPTQKNKRDAVFHYNNSSAYVDAVLKLASLITEDKDRKENLRRSFKDPIDVQVEE